MAKPPQEKTIQRNIVKMLNGLTGCRARVHTAAGPYNQSGEPDIDAVLDGRAIKIEVKRRMKRGAGSLFELTREAFLSRGATELQAKTLEEWAHAHAIVGVVCSKDEVRELLAAHGMELPDE